MFALHDEMAGLKATKKLTFPGPPSICIFTYNMRKMTSICEDQNVNIPKFSRPKIFTDVQNVYNLLLPLEVYPILMSSEMIVSMATSWCKSMRNLAKICEF